MTIKLVSIKILIFSLHYSTKGHCQMTAKDVGSNIINGAKMAPELSSKRRLQLKTTPNDI